MQPVHMTQFFGEFKFPDQAQTDGRYLMARCNHCYEKPARMVWGTYFEKNCPTSKGHLLDFRGSEPLPGWFGALMQ